MDNRSLEAFIKSAQKICKEEGIKSEDALDRVNEIVQDASLEEPVTEAGKRVRAESLSIESPLSPVEVKFNYNQYRDDTTNKALVLAMEEIAKYKNLVILENPTDEYKKALEKDYQDCTIALFKIFNDNNVRMAEFEYLFGSIKSIISGLEGIIMDQVVGHSADMKSNLLGANNPGTGKPDHNYATYKHLIDFVEKLKKDKK